MLLGKQLCFQSINIRKPRYPSKFFPFSAIPRSLLSLYPISLCIHCSLDRTFLPSSSSELTGDLLVLSNKEAFL